MREGEVGAETLEGLLEGIRSREAPGEVALGDGVHWKPGAQAKPVYSNRNERLGIDFSVERLDFREIAVMDPRIVRIEPGSNNERHKHAHESIFVVLQGQAEVSVGDRRHRVEAGEVVFVPRWYFHQTFNVSASEELVVLAITDFRLTRAVLGDYDTRTRLAEKGDDAEIG